MTAERIFVVLCWILALVVGVWIGEKWRKYRQEHQDDSKNNQSKGKGPKRGGRK